MIGFLFILFNLTLIYGYQQQELVVPIASTHEITLEPGDQASLKLCSTRKLSFKKPHVYPNIENNLVYTSTSDRTATRLSSLIKGNAFTFDTSNLKSCILRMKYRDDVPLTGKRKRISFLFYYDNGSNSATEFNKKHIHVTLILKDMYNIGCDFSFSGILKQSTIVDMSNVTDNLVRNRNVNPGYKSTNDEKPSKWAIMNFFRTLFKSKKPVIVSQNQGVVRKITEINGKEKISKICSISLKTLPSRSFSLYCPGHLYPPNCFEQVYVRNDDGSLGNKKVDGARTFFGRFTRKIRMRNIKRNFKGGFCKCVVGNEVYMMDVEA